jgi:hypothetical protein
MTLVPVSLLSLGIGGVSLARHLREPSVGKVRPASSDVPFAEHGESAAEGQRFEGRYFSLAYPRSYRLAEAGDAKRAEGNRPASADSVSFVFSQGLVSKRLTAIVERADGTGFEESAAFKLRLSRPGTYRREPFETLGGSGTLFVKSESGPEQTAFLRRGDLLATVTLSSAGGSAEALKEELFGIVNRIEWH